MCFWQKRYTVVRLLVNGDGRASVQWSQPGTYFAARKAVVHLNRYYSYDGSFYYTVKKVD